MTNKLMFYGAGEHAKKLLTPNAEIKEDPRAIIENGVCFVDGDSSKQGTMFLGLPVLSITEALNRYPEADIYITVASAQVRSEISSMLYELGVAKERVLNALEYKLTCPYLEEFVVCGYHECAFDERTGIDCGTHSLKSCCSDYGKNNVDFVPIGAELKDAFQKFIKMRDGIVERLNLGQNTCCDGCHQLQMMYVPNKKRFSYVIFNELGRCNAKCIYCNHDIRLGRDVSHDVYLPDLMDLVKDYGFHNNGVVELCNGEITIHPDKLTYYDSVKDCNVMFLTNGLVYDPEISRRLQNGTGILNLSIDSGTRDTFLKVKGIDAFDRVVQNLKRYSEYCIGKIHLKYIVIPNVNDGFEDIDGFVALCEKVGVTSVHISRDLCLQDEAYNNEQTINAIKRMISAIEYRNIPYEFYDKEILQLF